jgi:hypothetical protein
MLSRSDRNIGVGKVKGRPANAHKQTHEMSFLIPRLDSRHNRIVISSPFTRQCYTHGHCHLPNASILAAESQAGRRSHF